MKITYIHTAAVPSTAANSVQVVKMCAAFNAIGVPSELLLPAQCAGSAASIQAQYKLAAPVKVVALPVLSHFAQELQLGVLAALYRTRSRSTVFYTRSCSVAAAAALFGCPVALEMHGPLMSLRPRLMKRFRRLASSKNLRSLVVISDSLKRHYQQELPELADKILVAHDGADPPADPGSPSAVTGEFTVGYVGQLYQGKGMEIIASLAPRCADITFHVVGGTPDDLKMWRQRLIDCTNVFFHGYVPHAQTAELIDAMDVVIAPYLRVVHGVGGIGANLAEWMSPLKLFEYMSRGKPIVTSDLPVLREVLEADVDALLCDPDELESWISALLRLRSDPSLRQRLGMHARRKFLAHYTWDTRARRIRDALWRPEELSDLSRRTPRY